MGIISFGDVPEEIVFELVSAEGFKRVVHSLDEYIDMSDGRCVSVFVGLDQEDIHDVQWHGVSGLVVSPEQSDQELERVWIRVQAKLKQLNRPVLSVVT